jgi:hypothetical protein
MADDPAPSQPAGPAPLPRRDPRPLVVHFLVDSAICFLAVLVVGLILGFGWVVLLITSLVIGAGVAPFSHRAEARALAERDAGAGPAPGTGAGR